MSGSLLLNMPANLENSAVATGLEKVSFHSNPKERQCQRMLKLARSSLLRDWFPCAGAVLSLAQTHRGRPQTSVVSDSSQPHGP